MYAQTFTGAFYFGEYGFVGGTYEEYQGYKMAFAFSGALSEEDLAVAKYGIARMKDLIRP